MAQNQLHVPHKDLSADTNKELANAREVELWAAGPKDFLTLVDHVTLPNPAHYQVGTFIRVGAKLYQKVGSAWQEYGATFPLSIVSGSYSFAVSANINYTSNITVAGVTESDTAVYLAGLGNYSGLTYTSTRCGAGLIELIAWYNGASTFTATGTAYFLLVKGLDGP